MNPGKPQKYLTLAQEIWKQTAGEKGKIPSERELAQLYGCSHLTVRKALKHLADGGKIHSIPGRGWFCGNAVFPRMQKKSDQIGFIFPDDEIFYYRIFAEVERMAASNGLHPLVHLTGGSVQKEKELLEYFNQSAVQALIAVPNRECADAYRNLKIPVLFFDMRLPELDIPQIISDDYSGALAATEQLIRLGHTRIAHIGSEYDYTGEQRLNGYLDAFRKYGLPIRRKQIKMRYPSREWGYHAVRELFESKPVPTAVFCANDTIAAGVVNFCADRSIGIPEELSVAGFGNTQTAEYLNLSSVSQNDGKISGAICSNLSKLLNHEEIPPLTVIPTTCITRKSVGKPHR